ncbi:uncharacterized protein LOC103706141 isoform X1 [Phoenix dactylifera]|uniref:Uncharacterized protein LOC103706141 isoform X1 n=2 Tax=Phoenix dactylifera TaxID=42345 RepID=A0A8B7MTS3_PHODC|nr:uncharacterized protein LOC103706141 isoform X1 [Phoenix dactylifera]XP_008788376.2 uncharacterized protein LOC103706141 isoform X1 [Phoenix dactylifera]XP_017698032.2 uncharacterized protein LOC103706141 isoform X1 [Phoenix dactylifera]XP_026660108.2 uncharacterized protein LOC103706141 isoform X1 [Phoenix dactylifera]XP_038973515.1 uncharacterized protein LOC103706141 isoform X1 [Phoenix dactylifera]XP_038973518.1 uncharacterized protein LOC103706141 isoform X1 [Phoenix dactylifera]XP_03
MASAAAAINQAGSSKPLDESLWWDSFVHLFEEIDSAPLSDDLPDHLVKKIKNNRAWFLKSVTRFRPPAEASRLALDSSEITIGSHHLLIKPEHREAAFRVSKCLSLDEVQSYILVNRTCGLNKSVADIEGHDFLHLILLQYYLERQCLLKCIRRIFVHALYMENGSCSTEAVRGEALQLVSDGLEMKLLSILKDFLSSVFSEKTEVDFMVLWVEETLIEVNLVLDILFLAYYDGFCGCEAGQWKSLCLLFKDILCGSFNIRRLAVSVEARNSFFHAKAQLLLILIETMDLENLLGMVHDEVPFRQGYSAFTLSDIQEMDAEVSSFTDLGTIEAGPLILAWAVFLCLLLSLPDRQNSGMLMEIDHTEYVRQAFEAAPFNYLLEIVRSDTLRNSDGLVSGFFNVLRTFISAFIASYELSNQVEDNTLNVILNILCEIYNGEESLSMQFWDRDSFVDGPIRSVLYMLEREYPFRIVEFVRLLSALCEGIWPAECVYNYLDKMSAITTLFEIPGGSGAVNLHDIIEIQHQFNIPGIDGLVIPSGTCGQVLKVIDANVALVRWECAHSGVFLLLLRLAQEFHLYSYEEVFHTLNLLHRMMSSNKALCFALMKIGKSPSVQASKWSVQIENDVRVDLVKIICALVFSIVQDISNVGIVSLCFSILAEMLKCAPSYVIEVASKSNVFSSELHGSPSGTWLLSGGLARMLLVDDGESEGCFQLTTSVLDFTVELVGKGAADTTVSAFVVFSLQYVLVNHMHWNYKLKYNRWKVTLKVLEVMKSCIKATHVPNKLGSMIRDIIIYDSSVHNVLCQVMCISRQALEQLYISHHYELKEIEDVQLAVCSAFDIVYSILADLSEETFTNIPGFIQTVLSSTTKPMPVVTAAVSLISFSRNSAVQMAATRVLSILCFIASKFQSYSMENVNVFTDTIQIRELSSTICLILDEEVNRNEELIIAIFDLLNSASCYQPALLISVILPEEKEEVPSNAAGDMKSQRVVSPVIEPLSSKRTSPIDSILKYVERSEILTNSAPRLLLSIVNFLKALWEGGNQYIHVVDKIRSSEMFWKHLSSCMSASQTENDLREKNLNNDEIDWLSFRYQCQGAVLEIIAHELFFQEKLLQGEIYEKQTSGTFKGQVENRLSPEISKSPTVLCPKDILSIWCESDIMNSLIKSYSSSGYDKEVIFHAKVAVCMCILHLISKLSTANAGSLSISLIEKIRMISKKLSKHPAFAALLTQYSSRGYSKGKELANLVISDLYYHLQGELEGREITPGPFQELSGFLLDLETFQCSEQKQERNVWPPVRNVCMFDIARIQKELGMELWDHCNWKASKEVAHIMFLHMHEANLVMSIKDSKHFALKALITVISVYTGKISNKKPTLSDRGISGKLVKSSIEYVCECLQATADSLIPDPSPHENLLGFLATQVELLLVLSRLLFAQHSQQTDRRWCLPVSVLLIKTSGSAIKYLADVRPLTTMLKKAVKHLLMLLLTSVEFSYPKAYVEGKSDLEVKVFAEASLASIGLLPVLCKYAENTEYSTLSVASMDLMLKGFLNANIWLPILQKHLRLQLILLKVQQKKCLVNIPVILNFFLTLGCTKGGAEMLYSVNFFSSLKVLFDQLTNEMPLSSNLDGGGFTNINHDGKHVHLWGLGLAIIISVIYSIGDDSSSTDIVDSAIHYFFSEKAYVTFSYLSAPSFAAADHNKKRARIQKARTSLETLRLTELILMLICVLARYQASWSRGMKDMDSELRETIIHLLAFISKGSHRIGESPIRTLTLFCPPTTKEEVELHGRPSFVKSKHGWFTLSPVGFLVDNAVTSDSNTGSSLLIKDQASENADSVQQTYFSDIVAIQMYKLAFLLLKFLCMQAKAAAKRAEELEFIDLAHFPELPVPDILHGLQDQAIGIITEVCEANQSKPILPETESVCLLMLQILEKSLYLELCVSQSCGIRPVLGRIEDFSKGIKLLMRVAEQHTKFGAKLRSLRQITALVYPGLLQTNNLI